MAVNSCRKGKVGERAWCKQLRDWGIDARRGVQYQGGPDSPDVVTPNLRIHWEVKFGKPWDELGPGTKSLEDAFKKAEKETPPFYTTVMAWKPRNTRAWLLTWQECVGCEMQLVTAKANGELVRELDAAHEPQEADRESE